MSCEIIGSWDVANLFLEIQGNIVRLTQDFLSKVNPGNSKLTVINSATMITGTRTMIFINFFMICVYAS